jgi:Nidogen-like
MTFFSYTVTSVTQSTDGALNLYNATLSRFGNIAAYGQDLDTSNGGSDQNLLWVRTGTSLNDLKMARDIIAGAGTLFHPQAIIVATWYKVEAFNKRRGAQNTFQLAVPYSATGTTWVIFAYSQLQFYQSDSFTRAVVSYNTMGAGSNPYFFVDTNDKMIALLNGTNCNRTGVYAFPINTAPTKAPTKAPTFAPATNAPNKAPVKTPLKIPTVALPNAPVTVPLTAPTSQTCGLFGGSILCPRTRCGWLGRWLGFCQTV